MAKIELDDDGLPKPGAKNPEGMLAARFDQQTWDMIGQLKALWEAERKQRLTIKDVVRSCIMRQYNTTLKNVEVTTPAPAAEPPLTPIEEYEEKVKTKKAKPRYVRKP